MEGIMTKLLSIATATLALSIPAITHGANVTETANAVPVAIAELATACPLSNEVRAGIAELREYGERFQPAIALVVEEAAKPDWTWGPKCDAAYVVIQAVQN
jgi:hypothetical protein